MISGECVSISGTLYAIQREDSTGREYVVMSGPNTGDARKVYVIRTAAPTPKVPTREELESIVESPLREQSIASRAIKPPIPAYRRPPTWALRRSWFLAWICRASIHGQK